MNKKGQTFDAVFWDNVFHKENTNWGFEPADSALLAKDLFLEHNLKKILIPGIGYGRNATVFLDNGMVVHGIEVSAYAIELARKSVSSDMRIFHGSVLDMPFDQEKYDGIFCYALLHLFDIQQRKKILNDCFHQLKPNGYMVFTVVSRKASMYGHGKLLSKHRYRLENGLSVFFYDHYAISKEFESFGLMDYCEIDEPIKHMKNEPPLKCFYVVCKRQ